MSRPLFDAREGVSARWAAGIACVEIRHDQAGRKRAYLRLSLDEAKKLVTDIEAVIAEREEDDPDETHKATSQEIERLAKALGEIEGKARWYADNLDRDPHEVDHALCVEVLDLAQRALEVSCG